MLRGLLFTFWSAYFISLVGKWNNYVKGRGLAWKLGHFDSKMPQGKFRKRCEDPAQ